MSLIPNAELANLLVCGFGLKLNIDWRNMSPNANKKNQPKTPACVDASRPPYTGRGEAAYGSSA